MNNKELHTCRICGLYYGNSLPWGQDGKSPNYGICSCCGVEFGYEDQSNNSIKEYRRKWIDNGAKWFKLNKKPENWSLEEQMKNIPEEYK